MPPDFALCRQNHFTWCLKDGFMQRCDCDIRSRWGLLVRSREDPWKPCAIGNNIRNLECTISANVVTHLVQKILLLLHHHLRCMIEISYEFNFECKIPGSTTDTTFKRSKFNVKFEYCMLRFLGWSNLWLSAPGSQLIVWVSHYIYSVLPATFRYTHTLSVFLVRWHITSARTGMWFSAFRSYRMGWRWMEKRYCNHFMKSILKPYTHCMWVCGTNLNNISTIISAILGLIFHKPNYSHFRIVLIKGIV